MNAILFFKNKKILIGIAIILVFALSILISNISNQRDEEKNNNINTTTTENNRIKTTTTLNPTPSPMIYLKNDELLKNNDKNEIEDLLYNVTGFKKEDIFFSGYYLLEEWAIVSIEPKEKLIDATNTVLKKENGKWTIVEGPATYFDKNELIKKGAPAEISEKAEIVPISIIFEIIPEP